MGGKTRLSLGTSLGGAYSRTSIEERRRKSFEMIFFRDSGKKNVPVLNLLTWKGQVKGWEKREFTLPSEK